MIHCVKCEASYFSALEDGTKTFEVRFNDRDYRVGDYLAVNEVSDGTHPTYTGRCCFFEITYVLKDYDDALKPNYVVLGLSKLYLKSPEHVVRDVDGTKYNLG